jgi:alpha-tubulin suppressor-like RCC1 family protein
LGNFQTNTRSTPITTFLGGNNWSSISLGRNHTAAIKTDGSLWLWGSTSYGQLGIFVGGITAFRSTPITTFLGGSWLSVSCGAFHTAAVRNDGTMWCWGRNDTGALGNNKPGSTNAANYRSTPITTLSTGLTWSSVACGYEHTVAIKTDGSLWSWGTGSSGQLGDNNIISRSTPVTTLLGGFTWSSVTCGSNHTVALKTDGTLWSWGSNSSGQLGVNNTTDRRTPVTTLLGGTNWKTLGRLNCETISSVAIKTDGTLWTWGRCNDGQLGINATPLGRSTPVTTIIGGYFWKSASIGQNHGLGIQVATNDFI